MENWNKICGISALFLIFSAFSFGQTNKNYSLKASESSTTLTGKTFSINSIPPDYYTKNMGFFCKKELILEKAIKIPLRFRLGSLNYCNYLEGKKN